MPLAAVDISFGLDRKISLSIFMFAQNCAGNQFFCLNQQPDEKCYITSVRLVVIILCLKKGKIKEKFNNLNT